MSIFPDWLHIDIGTEPVAVFVESLDIDIVDEAIEIELDGAIEVELIDDTLEVEII